MNGVSFTELLRYTELETAKWRTFLNSAGPAILEVQIDTAGRKDLRGVLQHIFAVELRYSERLLETAETPYEKLPTESLGELFGIHAKARENIKQWQATTDERDLAKVLTFQTITAGTLSASKRKILAHALLHGIRHWGQVAAILRQKGYKQEWGHDFIFSDALE
jgi:uncharacterized damage-inducible protein DinB